MTRASIIDQHFMIVLFMFLFILILRIIYNWVFLNFGLWDSASKEQ